PFRTRRSMARNSLRLPRFSANCREREVRSGAMAVNVFAQERPRVNRLARRIQTVADQVNRGAQRHERQSLVEERVDLPEIGFSGLSWSYNHRHFASWRIVFVERSKVLKISAANVFMELGQFARDSGLAFAEHEYHILERFFQPLRRLEKNQGRAQIPEFIQSGAARRARGRQKTDEEKLVRRQSGQDERSEHRRGARNSMNLHSRSDRLAHKFVAGIGNEGCSR